MKRIVFTLSLGLLFLFTLGCAYENPVPDSIMQKTNELYQSRFGSEFSYDAFYGNYDDSWVFYLDGDAFVVKTLIIDEFEFEVNNDWTIIIYHDGALYKLDDYQTILSQGILTLNQIGQIHQQHLNYHKDK